MLCRGPIDSYLMTEDWASLTYLSVTFKELRANGLVVGSWLHEQEQPFSFSLIATTSVGVPICYGGCICYRRHTVVAESWHMNFQCLLCPAGRWWEDMRLRLQRSTEARLVVFLIWYPGSTTLPWESNDDENRQCGLMSSLSLVQISGWPRKLRDVHV